jgi:hypothetical protein
VREAEAFAHRWGTLPPGAKSRSGVLSLDTNSEAVRAMLEAGAITIGIFGVACIGMLVAAR